MLKFLILLIFIISLDLSAQPWSEDKSDNFYEIQKQFNEYWKDKDYKEKGKGWKAFKRWENFWEERVYPSGIFPSNGLIIQEYNKLIEKRNNQKKYTVQASSKWSFKGPMESSGGYSGLGRVNTVSVNPSDPNQIWVGAASGGLWKSEDGGSSWSTQTDKLDVMPTLGISDIQFDPNNSSIMYIGTGDVEGNTYSVGVLKSTDGGTTWKTTGLSFDKIQGNTVSRILVSKNNSNLMLASGNFGIYRSSDAGVNWTRVFQSGINDMEFSDMNPDVIVAVSSSVYKSTDAGVTWTKITNGVPTSGMGRTSLAVGKNNNTMYFVASNGSGGFFGLYKSTNAGDSWTQQSSTPNILNGSTDGSGTGGQGWYDICIAVDPNNSNNIFVGGINIWKSTNSGVDWTLKTYWYNINGYDEVHADQHYLGFYNGNLFAGNDGGVYFSNDLAENWLYIGSGIHNTQFYKIGIAETNSNMFIGGAQDNGTKLFKDNDWVDKIGGDGFECTIDKSNVNIIYASLYYGSFFKSTDKGETFKRINDNNNDDKYDNITETGGWVTPFQIDPSNSSNLYLAMKNVWKSTDKGSTFTKISNYNSGDISVMSVSPSNAKYIYIYVSGSLRRTSDGGTTWETKTKPANENITGIAIHSTQPNTIYVTLSGYSSGKKVYQSTDGGATWTNLSKDLTNIPCNTIVYQKNTNNRIFIGTDFGVFYTDDQSDTWFDYNDGLPNTIARELEINITAQKLVVGTYGRGIWDVDLPTNIVIGKSTLLSPINNKSMLPLINNNFTWTVASSATSYQIQIAKDSLFANIVEFDDSVSQTSYFNVNNLSGSTIYYWRVRGRVNNQFGAWSEKFSFSTKLSAPIILKSSESQIQENSEFLVQWYKLAGSEKYKLISSKFSDFSEILDTYELTDTFKFITHTAYLSNLYWKVSGFKDGEYTDYSKSGILMRKLIEATLISPSNNAKLVSFKNTKFDWSLPLSAKTINLVVTDVNTGSKTIDLELNSNFQKEYTHNSNLKAANSYKWKIRYLIEDNNNNLYSEFSPEWSFSTINDQVKITNPKNNDIIPSDTINFTWNSLSNVIEYQIQVSIDSSFKTNLIDKKVKTLNLLDFTLPNLAKYYIRAKADNGDWSDIIAFTKKKIQKLILSEPITNSTKIDNKTLNLKWEKISAKNYKLILKEASTNKEIISTDTITQESFLVLNLKPFNNYIWQVIALDGNKNEIAISDYFTFRTKMALPTLISPINNAQKQDTALYLNWKFENNANESVDYSIELDHDNIQQNFTSKDTSYFVSGLKYSTLYTWKIKVDFENETTDWTNIFKFPTKDKSGNSVEDENTSYINSYIQANKLIINEMQNIKSIKIFDLAGHEISNCCEFEYSDMKVNVEISTLIQGVYFIKIIQNDNKVYTSKFIK